MVWAILAAAGVAIVSMTLFGARLTRRAEHDSVVEDLEGSDPDDPWAAWKPRSFEELDRPRPRVWPLLAAVTGLVMVGAGFAGARQTLWAAPASSSQDLVTPRPYTVEVDIPATPTPVPATPTPAPATPAPTPRAEAAATASPTSAAGTAAPAGQAPTLTGSGSCSGGTARLSYNATAHGTTLKWLAVYVDGSVARGGPLSGSSHSGSFEQAASAGAHDLEVSVEDAAGRTSRKQFRVTCA